MNHLCSCASVDLVRIASAWIMIVDNSNECNDILDATIHAMTPILRAGFSAQMASMCSIAAKLGEIACLGYFKYSQELVRILGS